MACNFRIGQFELSQGFWAIKVVSGYLITGPEWIQGRDLAYKSQIKEVGGEEGFGLIDLFVENVLPGKLFWSLGIR